jgi:hypothetical protein
MLKHKRTHLIGKSKKELFAYNDYANTDSEIWFTDNPLMAEHFSFAEALKRAQKENVTKVVFRDNSGHTTNV